VQQFRARWAFLALRELVDQERFCGHSAFRGRAARKEKSAKIEDKLESVVDTTDLVERQVRDLIPEDTRIDGTNHLAHDQRLLVTDRHLGMKACWRC
jgi:hypothetical protein